MSNCTINSLDNQSFSGYIAQPSGGVGPGLLVVQEIFGVNANMRAVCDAFAKKGYIAVCPDLFWRLEPNVQISDQSPDEWPRAFSLYKAFDVEAGVRDLLATLAFMRKLPGCGGKVGTIGYSLGGKMAFLLAARSDVDCAVSYYGIGLESLLAEVPDVRMPTLLHLGEKDKFVPASDRARLLKATERNKALTTNVYPNADHGFAREGSQTFNQEAAQQAQTLTDAFLTEWLKG